MTNPNPIITCGITNVPLTKPAKVYFNIPFDAFTNLELVYSIFENLKIPIKRIDNNYMQMAYITTLNEVDTKIIKMIFKNFRTLRPKLNSNWRYLFWEIDNQDEELLYEVLEIYRFMKLPVYVHKTMRGYHFLSVKPIQDNVFQWCISNIRRTNIKYPPLTLRIKPNKYPNEKEIWNEGFIISDTYHADTKYLRDWIVNQDYIKLQEHYQIVWYPLIKTQEELDAMTYEQRLIYEQEQIDYEKVLNQ